jgi:hypothetical protein
MARGDDGSGPCLEGFRDGLGRLAGGRFGLRGGEADSAECRALAARRRLRGDSGGA